MITIKLYKTYIPQIIYKKLTLIILLILIFWLYSRLKQHDNKNNNIISNIVLPYTPTINNDLRISRETYSQMKLIQQQMYLLRLLGFDSSNMLQNIEQKSIIEKQIISQLSKERQSYVKENNNKQLSSLSEKIQSAINLIQNPFNCSNARFLVCRMEEYLCGFGCMIHHVSYCLSISTGTGRTLIFEDEGIKIFRYNVKWNELFKAITNCSYAQHVKPYLPLQNYTGPQQADRIVFLVKRRDINPDIIPHAPEVAPSEVKKFLLQYHSNPSLWFLGQLIKYIWRENERTKNETNQIVSKIPFDGSVVGVHVRLTDKKLESKIQKLEDYMKWVDFWYDVMENTNQNNSTKRNRAFIAADHSVLDRVINEAKSKWGNKYEIYHGNHILQVESRESLIETLAITRILAKCRFVVCTFSSNVCRLVYELMQSFQGDASENVHSLDYFYGEFWYVNKMEAIAQYLPISEYPWTPEEISAEKGDVIEVKSPIQNGFIRGKNLRLNTEGRFPMYLLKEHSKFQNFKALNKITK